MVHVLISLRRTIVRHQLARTNPAASLVMAALVLLSALGTCWVGLASYPDLAGGTDVLALLFLLWLGGRIAQTALAGDPVLRPELFSLLPLSRRKLALRLLVVGALDPAGLFMAVAFVALFGYGVRLGAGPAAVAFVAVVATLALASVLCTVAAAALGPGSRRGHDIGTIVTAVAISAVAVAATLLPALVAALRRGPGGSARWLAAALRVLPSGWGPVAVEAAARNEWLAAAGWLAGLAALTVAVAACWPAVLSRRMDAAARPARAGGGHRGRRPVLPRTAAGAVTAKEVRMWVRDPIRLTCLLIAVVVGAAACAIPRVTAGTNLLLPFAGLGTALIAGACACNLYGSDGTSLWLTIMTPGAARADVRGRQAAWLLVVAPYTIAVTIAFTALSGDDAAWPWVLAVLPALLGGAAGLAPLSSLISVQPLDETGNPTPAWSLKVHVMLVVVALTATVPVLVLVTASAGHVGWLSWAAVPVGVATGVVLAGDLGRRATRRLETRQAGVLKVLADAAR
jgi:ABC-2 type transport system permease protein